LAGVRRIFAVTGARAVQAAQEARNFAQRLESVCAMPDSPDLEPAVVKLVQDLVDPNRVMPASQVSFLFCGLCVYLYLNCVVSDDRRQVLVFHKTLDQLQERVKNFNKKQKGSDEERAKQFAQQAIEQLKAKPTRYFVARVQVDGNDKAHTHGHLHQKTNKNKKRKKKDIFTFWFFTSTTLY
jgi:alanyl-tRNA synthetase